MAYATAATGFKDGGFNARAAATGPFTFDPETVTSYEAGVEDLAVRRQAGDQIGDGLIACRLKAAQVSTLNPDDRGRLHRRHTPWQRVRVEGVEIDAHARPISELTLNASLSYDDSVSAKAIPRASTSTGSGRRAHASRPQGVDAAGARARGRASATIYQAAPRPILPKWRWSLGASSATST